MHHRLTRRTWMRKISRLGRVLRISNHLPPSQSLGLCRGAITDDNPRMLSRTLTTWTASGR